MEFDKFWSSQLSRLYSYLQMNALFSEFIIFSNSHTKYMDTDNEARYEKVTL